MILNCSTEKSVRMQHNVGKALHDMLKEMSYDKVTVSDLCVRANLPRRSFYRYFESKRDVLDYVMADLMRDCILFSMECLPEDDNLEKVFFRFFVFWKEKKAQWIRILRDNHLETVLVRMFQEWLFEERRIRYMQRGIGEEQLRIALTFALGGIMMILFQWGEDGFSTDEKVLARYASSMLTQSLYPVK